MSCCLLLLASSGVVGKPGELALMLQQAVADRRVTVLDHIDLGNAALAQVRIGIAVGDQDDVGVLLDLARVAQVGHLGLLGGARLDATVELRQDDHRHVQFLAMALMPRLIAPSSRFRFC